MTLLEATVTRIRLQADKQISALRSMEREIKELEKIAQWMTGCGYSVTPEIQFVVDRAYYWIEVTADEKRVVKLLKNLSKINIPATMDEYQRLKYYYAIYTLNAWDILKIKLGCRLPISTKQTEEEHEAALAALLS
ncbi:MAG: hypothetical protein LBE32_05490 [Burkholderiales bacterium]|nr:hypothetical protein [Burkholderiales bacterium]